ncbi:MAG: hypothetical protein DRI61_02910 [Chloroflexi bacterium]|nr:MAG: hypothetical protein DRI61_02910 [Chloroflexota bacterium]
MQLVNMKAKFFVAGLVLILLNPIFASTIGATIDKTYAEINKGDVGKFKISVFSLENSTLDIEVSSTKVNDLQIDIVPKHFEINSEITSNPQGNYEWVILDGDKYVRVYNVYVYIRPKEITQNHYNVPVTISAYKKSNQVNKGIVQNVIQSLQYTLHIYVPGEIVREEEFVNLTNIYLNFSNYPAYQLPSVTPTNIYNPPSSKGQQKINEEKVLKEEHEQQSPTGFFYLPEDKKDKNTSLGMIIIIIIVIFLLIVYLLRK